MHVLFLTKKRVGLSHTATCRCTWSRKKKSELFVSIAGHFLEYSFSGRKLGTIYMYEAGSL